MTGRLFLMMLLIVLFQRDCNGAENTGMTGDQVTIKRKIFGAIDQTAMDAVVRASVANDSVGIQQLVDSGRAVVIDEGSQALMLKPGISYSHVRLADGRAVFVDATATVGPPLGPTKPISAEGYFCCIAVLAFPAVFVVAFIFQAIKATRGRSKNGTDRTDGTDET